MDSSFEILQSLLRSPVGEYQDSDPDDVKQTRRNFNALGLESGDPERGYIDRELDTTIREFQRDMDLKEDGLMNPGGETEQHVNSLLHLVSENVIKSPILSKKQVPIPPQEPVLKTKNRIIELDKTIISKQRDIHNIRKWVTGIGAAAGGIGGGLTALAFTKNPKNAIKAGSAGAAVAAERGKEIADKMLNGLKTEIDLLKNNKEILKQKINK